jgi:hypothetical protein
VLLGAITKLYRLPTPDLDAVLKSLAVVVIGVIYRFTPLRSWINKSYFDRVNENIRSQMVAMAGLIDNKKLYTWGRLRRVFYDIVDHDESLKVKGQRVMFNGLIWTSCADLTAISVLFLGYSLILVVSQVHDAAYAALAYFAFALVGFVGSIKTTEKHIELGNEQLDLMEEKYARQIRDRLQQIHA